MAYYAPKACSMQCSRPTLLLLWKTRKSGRNPKLSWWRPSKSNCSRTTVEKEVSLVVVRYGTYSMVHIPWTDQDEFKNLVTEPVYRCQLLHDRLWGLSFINIASGRSFDICRRRLKGRVACSGHDGYWGSR